MAVRGVADQQDRGRGDDRRPLGAASSLAAGAPGQLLQSMGTTNVHVSSSLGWKEPRELSG